MARLLRAFVLLGVAAFLAFTLGPRGIGRAGVVQRDETRGVAVWQRVEKGGATTVAIQFLVGRGRGASGLTGFILIRRGPKTEVLVGGAALGPDETTGIARGRAVLHRAATTAIDLASGRIVHCAQVATLHAVDVTWQAGIGVATASGALCGVTLPGTDQLYATVTTATDVTLDKRLIR